MNADPAVEQRVIGAVVLSAGRVLRDLNLDEEDFASPPHAELWRGVQNYLAAGKPLTPELFAAYVRDRRPVLMPVLVECLGGVGVPDEAAHFAGHLRTLTARRRVEQAAAALAQLAQADQDMTPEELAEAARGQVDRFTDRRGGQGGTTTLGDAYLGSLDRWAIPDTNVLPTGWRDLDEVLTGGLRPGHLTVIGARPAIGKSLLATELARMVASRGVMTSIHSLEMTTEEVTDRIASSVTRVPLAALTGGTTDAYEQEALSDGLAKVADWPLHIDDRSGVGITAIRTRCRDLTREGELGLVIVDYLQLVRPLDAKAPREQQVSGISRGLKLMAKDLGVPVVALAQVNRAGAAANPRDRPQMHHLRESGSIEADADEIMLLHRNIGLPEGDEDDLYGQLEVNVVKNRHGDTRPIRLAWIPAAGRIADADR